MPSIEGYEPLRIHRLDVRAKLPAAMWRLVSIAERPDPFNDIRPVIVDDAGTRAVVLSASHYEALVYRLRDLERWAAEGEGEA